MAFVHMRKVITTEMLNRASPQEQAILRRVLAHSEKTSQEWYTCPDLTDIGVQVAQIIQRLLDADDAKDVLYALFLVQAVELQNNNGFAILERGDTVIMDNCGFHHGHFVEPMLTDMLAEYGLPLQETSIKRGEERFREEGETAERNREEGERKKKIGRREREQEKGEERLSEMSFVPPNDA
ncbi:hypothetical protein ACROYT_G014669 [Oculina patagonica]